MRKVIDANCMADPALETFLASDRGNFAVLTEFAGMEAFKGDAVRGILASMRILSKHATQVLLLKGTKTIVAENQAPDTIDLESFVDPHQTAGFAKFCHVLNLAEAGDAASVLQLQTHGSRALEEIQRLEADTHKAAQGIVEIGKTFNPGHVKTLRQHRPMPEGMVDKMMRDILVLSALMIRDHPEMHLKPTARQLKNSYIFRYSLCAYLLCLDWIEKGGLNNIRLGRLANDLTDVTYAAYATLFDGILSHDAKVNRIYKSAIEFLEVVFKLE